MGLVEASYSIGQKVEYYSEARGPTAAERFKIGLCGHVNIADMANPDWMFLELLHDTIDLRSKMLEEKNNLRIRLVGGPPHVEAQ